ncbi:EAL domain-containing protein [Aeromonas sp.]|uniref:EAL domain-containing protein n=1 Tax=Aeromonas sp. TaxID=647 RepID=UPI002584F518|nr:EAL domain-containing protein [Aeromonas sp.]MCX7127471.1 EAL domain-containing protein [Aeromonas sp.]
MRISPVWISLLLFALPIVGSQSLGLWFAKPMAFHLLENKVTELKEAMAERHRELDAAINKQLAQFKFDCGAKDMMLLRDPRFYSNHIRLQGLELASGNSCSSLGVGITMLKDAQNNGQKYGKLGITATVAKFNTEQELVAYYQSGGNLAYWVLDNSWSHEQLQHPCTNCFYLEFSRQAPDAATVHFPRGDKTIKHEEGSRSLSFYDPNELTRKTIWAGKALEQYAHDQLNHYGLWSGIVLGALLSAAYWLLRNYRRSLKGLLQTGLAKREFVPFYQPVVNSQTRQVVGFEALLRWQRGNELIPPGSFIDYAEEQGLILPMTEQLLEQVISDLPLLAPEQWVSVNLVATHIEQPLLRQLLAKHHNPSPDQLNFELTERKPIHDIKAATEEITLLQQMGYHFKLDDFGTGYGGFAYLQSLGIRQIKIDKMFVDTIGTNDLKRSVLDAIIAFGRESGMEMIAEGVETQRQVDYLSQHGVYLIQGYVFGKPMPLKMLPRWQQEWQLQHREAS